MSNFNCIKEYVYKLTGEDIVMQLTDDIEYDSSVMTKIYINFSKKKFYIPARHYKYFEFCEEQSMTVVNTIPKNDDIQCVLVPRTKVPYPTNSGTISLFNTSINTLAKYGVAYLDSGKIHNYDKEVGTIIGTREQLLWFYFIGNSGLTFFPEIDDKNSLFRIVNIINNSTSSLDVLSKNVFINNIFKYEYDLSKISKYIIIGDKDIYVLIKEILGQKIYDIKEFDEKIKYFRLLPKSYQKFLFGHRERDDQIFIAKIFLDSKVSTQHSAPAPYIFDLIENIILGE